MITIILPISRMEYLRPVFNCLANLEKPPDTELLIITDGNKELEKAVDKRLDSIRFERIQVISFGNSPAETINDRRFRIAAIHNKARHYISDDCDYVLLLEDDTTYPPDTLTKFINTFNSVDNCTFVEGVQLGRHQTSYIGGWLADDINSPTKIHSFMPALVNGLSLYKYHKIDAGGLYCALVDAQLYKIHTFAPYDLIGKNGLGCDVNFGFYLRQQGYKCYIDWSIQCDHIGDKGSVNLGNTKPRQVVFEKNNKIWSGRTI